MPGASSGFCWSALMACILALVSSGVPVIAVLAKPRPAPTPDSPVKDSIPRPIAALVPSKNPTLSGARPGFFKMSFSMAETISACDIVSGKLTCPTLGMLIIGTIHL